MGDPSSISFILWSADPATQRAIYFVLIPAAVALLAVYGPLLVRLIRLVVLERRLRNQPKESDERSAPMHAEGLREAMVDSPLREVFHEFERRWENAQLGETRERSPIRLMDVLDDRPLLPFGPRRSLLPVLPGIFLGVGVFAALTGLIPSLAEMGAEDVARNGQSGWIASQLGLALRASAWGFICAIAASLTGRLIEGGFIARSASLDALVEAQYGSVSPGELAELTRQTQQRNLDTLGRELSQFANELNERLDRGLQRIEQSTSRSASLISQEQRGALHTIVQELSLSVRQGVDTHLGELRGALQKAVEHQTSVTGGLAETFERMVENSHTQDRVARSLTEAAQSVEDASKAMKGSAGEMQPVLEKIGSTSQALTETATRINESQQVVARTAEGVRNSLEYAATGVDDQRKFAERSLTEIRQSIVSLGDGLGTNLQRSLRDVDDVLGATVGQLRETLSESNETIERLAEPIRASEGATRETHLALDRVRGEVEALGQWMTQAAKPLRAGLSDVESRSDEIARALNEFANTTRKIDKTMESLRIEIHDESRRLQGTGSDLSRRLSLTSDTLSDLDSSPSETSRRSSAIHRDRSWPEDPPGSVSGSASDDRNRLEDSGLPAPALSSTATSASESPSSNSDQGTKEPRPRTVTSRFGGGTSHGEQHEPEDSTSSSDGSEDDGDGNTREGSGYRMGSPRAQGPDPYARFDSPETPPSNVRHFPTRDRELGDDLKLSGLLGPSGVSDDDDDGESDASPNGTTRNGKRKNKRSSKAKPKKVERSPKPAADDAE